MPIFAAIVELHYTSFNKTLVLSKIQKLYKLANSSLPSDAQLILPKIIFASDLAANEDFI